MVGRRNFLRTASIPVIGGLAGCADDRPKETDTTLTESPLPTTSETPTVSDFRAAKDPFTKLTTNKEGTGFGQSGIATLPKHRFGVLPLSPPGRFHIEGTVQSQTNPFDFIILLVEEFERYQKGEEFSYVEEVTNLGTTKGMLETTLPQEEYRIVFDNTWMGEATVVTKVVINFEWRITPPEK